jgi:DHA2 family multidrug resistance protein
MGSGTALIRHPIFGALTGPFPIRMASSTTPVSAPSAAAAAIEAHRWLILLGLITAAVMEVLDTTIINVALPQMAGNVGATTQEIAWVSTSYILANVVVLPMTAFFTERFGR